MDRPRPPLLLVGLLSLAVLLSSPPTSAQVGVYTAADPSAPPVTAETLPAVEQFWPYRAQLLEDHAVEGRPEPLPKGSVGVLVTISVDGTARLDFGRDGRAEVPASRTDLVLRANEVRMGNRRKVAPNFVHAVGPRLVDPSSEPLAQWPLHEAFGPPAFLAVFATPAQITELGPELRDLRGRRGVETIVFPQGRRPDAEIRDLLRAVSWEARFVLSPLSEGYTRSRLADEATLPAVMLVTPDGRVLHQEQATNDSAPRLADAIDRHLAAAFDPEDTDS